tara:strand:- start:539 stop:1183 length:645 start_codon:yes stop_codon:yes gene_type:complete
MYKISALVKRILNHYSSPSQILTIPDSDEYVNMDKNTTVFLGGSIVRRWPLQDLQDVGKVINMGRDSLRVDDLIQLQNRTKLETLEARQVCFYCGSNDFFQEIDPKDISTNTINVLKCIKCPILYINIIPSPFLQEFSAYPHLQNTLDTIDEYIKSRGDTSKTISTKDLFSSSDFQLDGVHLRDSGYEKLTKCVKKELIVHNSIIDLAKNTFLM